MLLEERALDRACARQDEIGNRSGRRQVVVDHHDQIESHERVEHAMRIGIGEQRVRRVHDERAHRIGLACLHRAEYEIGMSRGHVACRKPATQALGHLLHFRVALVALKRGVGGVQAARLVLGRHLVGHLELDFRGEVAHLSDDAGAGLVDVARDRAQTADRAVRGRHVAARLVDTAPRNECRRLGTPEPARRSADVIGRHAAELGDVLGRVARHMGGELVEAVAPFRHEIAVVEALGDDDVREAERKGAIRTRLRRDPQIGAGGSLGVARIDHHEWRIRLSDAANRLPPQRIV